MDIRQLIVFVLLVLMIAFYVLLGLFILARALTTIVRDIRSVKGQTENGTDRGENVEFEMRRTRLRRRQEVAFVDSARISTEARPEPAGVKTKAAIIGDAEPRARERGTLFYDCRQNRTQGAAALSFIEEYWRESQ